MKINIGKYPRWLTAAHLYKLFPEKIGDWLDDKVQPILNIWNNSRFNQRKVHIHIDNYDVWNADSTLAMIIVPVLKKLKEVKQGTSFVDDEDVPEYLRSTSAKPLSDEDKAMGVHDEFFVARWNWVLDEMIWAFEQSIDNEWEDQYYYDENIDSIGLQNHYDRMKRGRILFAKYYDGLWD